MTKRIKHFSKGRKTLFLNTEIANVIELVCQHWNNEEEFEDNGMDLSKGLLLGGNVGSGKTEILQTYKDMKNFYKLNSVRFTKCKDCNKAYMVKDTFSRDGGVMGLYGIRHAISSTGRADWIFDELGGEETYVQDYGNKFAVMPYIIDERESHGLNIGKTHFTTNLSKEQILDKYGSRTESRLYKSVNFIGLGIKSDSLDHRKQ
ncbi:MAG: hypothetical protein ACJASM_002036 [Salibacteraceae bacterium]|jgi:hypothetical protein